MSLDSACFMELGDKTFLWGNNVLGDGIFVEINLDLEMLFCYYDYTFALSTSDLTKYKSVITIEG